MKSEFSTAVDGLVELYDNEGSASEINNINESKNILR